MHLKAFSYKCLISCGHFGHQNALIFVHENAALVKRERLKITSWYHVDLVSQWPMNRELLGNFLIIDTRLIGQVLTPRTIFTIGNCDICAEQKISLTNKTKWYKFHPRLKGWVQKIFQTLPPNFVNGLNKSCLKFGH